MTRSQEYLFKAAQLSALAEEETNSALKNGYRQLAENCLHMAEQSDRNMRELMKNLIEKTRSVRSH